MKPQESTINKGIAQINNGTSFNISRVNIDSRSFNIYLKNKEAIIIYTFNSLMFPIDKKRKGTEVYEYKGPCLGLYYAAGDIREGPYVNHYIDTLNLSIKYEDKSAAFHIKGRADMSKSSYDSHRYHGATNGIWTFEVKFIHNFKSR